jgi:hypothetical protein
MKTLRIHDLTPNGGLAFDLRDLLALLKPQSLQADWVIFPVKSDASGYEWFEATGEHGDTLEKLANEARRLSGSQLARIAKNTHQVIWGQFSGLYAGTDDPWVTIQAIDSTFYEVITSDEAVLKTIRSTFRDVREVEAPYQSFHWTEE